MMWFCREWRKTEFPLRACIVIILGTWALFHVVGVFTFNKLYQDVIDLGFLCLCPFLVASIVAGWLHAERRPWIVWQGELCYGYLTRQLVPMFVAFILILGVAFAAVFTLSFDLMVI